MKIVLYFKKDEELKGITPRMVRNFCGSITDQRFVETIMYHDKPCPPVCYLRPYKNSIHILFNRNDYAVFSHLMERLEKNKDNFYGKKITKIVPMEAGFNPPFYMGDRTIKYFTRTPMLIVTNETEHHLKYNLEKDGRIDEYIRHRIVSSIKYQLQCYFGVAQDFDNLQITLGEFNIFSEQYKEGVWKNAFFGNFECNYSLPDLVGYGIGLGYGELVKDRSYEFAKGDNFTTLKK